MLRMLSKCNAILDSHACSKAHRSSDMQHSSACEIGRQMASCCDDVFPYWHKIIPHNYIVSAPAGCNSIHWGLQDNGF